MRKLHERAGIARGQSKQQLCSPPFIARLAQPSHFAGRCIPEGLKSVDGCAFKKAKLYIPRRAVFRHISGPPLRKAGVG